MLQLPGATRCRHPDIVTQALTSTIGEVYSGKEGKTDGGRETPLFSLYLLEKAKYYCRRIIPRVTAAREYGFVAVARDNVEHMYVCGGIAPANSPRYGTINFSANSPGDQTNRLGRVRERVF